MWVNVKTSNSSSVTHNYSLTQIFCFVSADTVAQTQQSRKYVSICISANHDETLRFFMLRRSYYANFQTDAVIQGS